MDLLSGLNPPQRQAATHPGGPLLILAGAGSGKTRVLTHRIAHLIRARGVSPRRILAVTFTNKAAGEMRARLDALLGGPVARELWMGTFHAICSRVLRMDGERVGVGPNFVIYDEEEQRKVVRESTAKLSLDERRYPPAAIHAMIGRAKDEALDAASYAARASNFMEDAAARVWMLYQEELRARGALDFDDLLCETLRLFDGHPDVLRSYQERFEHVLVDEYQDTNHVQYLLVRSIGGLHRNVTVVGDDDQCIVAGTPISRPGGTSPIEALEEGATVMAACGGGRLAPAASASPLERHYDGQVVTVRTRGGHRLTATPNHLVFGRLVPRADLYYVYLMHRRDKGYRIGRTRGSRPRRPGGVDSGLGLRLNGEVADRLWVIAVTPDEAEAACLEQLYAFAHGIPTTVFHVRGRRMQMEQRHVDRVFGAIDTEVRAHRLLAGLGMFPEYPHLRAGAVVRGQSARRLVHFTMFGDGRVYRNRSWADHRIQLVTSGEGVRARVDQHYPTRESRAAVWRVETARRDCDVGWHMARHLAALVEGEPVLRACVVGRAESPVGPSPRYRLVHQVLPLGHLQEGMMLAVVCGGRIVEDEVVSRTLEPYSGPVYDLDVRDLRTYVASGVLVHNSIYRWRGADVRNILEFERDYPDATVITLAQNYRSTKRILAAAGAVIKNNPHRHAKELWTGNQEGLPVRLYEAADGSDEARFVVGQVKEMADRGLRLREIAVLYRTNAQSRLLEEECLRAGVPYQIVGGVRFYERKEVKDLLAYLRLAVAPEDAASLRRAVATPRRGIGDVTLARLSSYAEAAGCTLLEAMRRPEALEGHTRSTVRAVSEFAAAVERLSEHAGALPASQVIARAISDTGYGAMLEAEATDEALDRLENLRELANVAREVEESTGEPHLAAFLQHLALISDIDTYREDLDQLTLMTLHSAKGLEFEGVFFTGLEEGLCPHMRAMEEEGGLEEERRLCYVGFTRAKSHLVLTHALMRSTFGSPLLAVPSRFLDEIPQEYVQEVRPSRPRQDPQPPGTSGPGGLRAGRGDSPLVELEVGDRVRHARFGEGEVLEVEGEGGSAIVTVRFAGAVKRLALGYAPMERF